MNEETQEKVTLDCLSELSAVRIKLECIECPIINIYTEHFEVQMKLLTELFELVKRYSKNKD